MEDAKPEPMTQEALFNIKRALQIGMYQSATKQLASHIREQSEGASFLAQWAQQWQQKALHADQTMAGIYPGMAAMVLADEYRDAVAQMLSELGLQTPG